MGHVDNQQVSTELVDRNQECELVVQELANANEEIADLKLQIAWLERSYE